MQEFIDDQLPINDLFTENLHLVLQSYTQRSVTVRCDSKDVFLNPYGFAHGGFLYTIGHIAARNMALVCLNRHMQVVQSTCQYLGMVHSAPITAEAKLVRNGKQLVFYDLDITDGNGELVAVALFTMQGVEYKANNLPQGYQNKAFKE